MVPDSHTSVGEIWDASVFLIRRLLDLFSKKRNLASSTFLSKILVAHKSRTPYRGCCKHPSFDHFYTNDIGYSIKVYKFRILTREMGLEEWLPTT